MIIEYYSADQCNVCHAVWPRIKSLGEIYSIDIQKIDIVIEQERAAQNQVFTIPTVLVKDNDRELLRESRFIDFLNIEKLLKAYNESLID